MLSGVGPAEHLQEFGSETLIDSRRRRQPRRPRRGIVQWDAKKPMVRHSTQSWEIGLFATSEEGLDRPDLMMRYGSVPFDMNTARWGYPTTETVLPDPNVCRGRSRGTVRLRSSDYRDRARVDPRYFTDPDGHDERVMAFGMRLARKIVSQSPMAEWAGAELAPGPDAQTDDELIDYMHRRTTPSTTRRAPPHGPGLDPTAVVDPRLRVRGVRRCASPTDRSYRSSSDQPVHHDDDGRRESRDLLKEDAGKERSDRSRRRWLSGPRHAARRARFLLDHPSFDALGADRVERVADAVELERRTGRDDDHQPGRRPRRAPPSRADRDGRDRPRRDSCSTCSARGAVRRASMLSACPLDRGASRRGRHSARIDAVVARNCCTIRPGSVRCAVRCSSGQRACGRRFDVDVRDLAQPVGALLRRRRGRSPYADPRRKRRMSTLGATCAVVDPGDGARHRRHRDEPARPGAGLGGRPRWRCPPRGARAAGPAQGHPARDAGPRLRDSPVVSTTEDTRRTKTSTSSPHTRGSSFFLRERIHSARTIEQLDGAGGSWCPR